MHIIVIDVIDYCNNIIIMCIIAWKMSITILKRNLMIFINCDSYMKYHP